MKKTELIETIKEEIRRMQELAGIKSEGGVQLSDPELAVRWWSRKEPSEKQDFLDKYLPQHKSDRMSPQDIYWLWKKQQKL
jgi:hypothetical protein